MAKFFKEDDMWLLWEKNRGRIYDQIYYQSNPLVAYINNAGHRILEKSYDKDTKFQRVLEVGAGSGMHLEFVQHDFDYYYSTDISDSLLEINRQRNIDNPAVKVEKQDALNLSYGDNSFDRLISVYNLEHLPDPHIALKEWARVVKLGGTLSIAFPTEGGIAWNLGRWLTTRRSFAREGLDLDYIIAREHINACYKLVYLVKHYFPQRQETWFPSRIPLSHCNLVYCANITV